MVTNQPNLKTKLHTQERDCLKEKKVTDCRDGATVRAHAFLKEDPSGSERKSGAWAVRLESWRWEFGDRCQ